MSYSRPTLAAFSAAIGRAYSDASTNAAGATPPSTPALALPPDAASDEDRAYLVELLASHHRAAAHPPPPSTGATASSSAPAVPNLSPLRGLGLTPRECEVIFWIAQGKRDAEIAVILGASAKTVSKHVEHILEKLGAETRLAAAHTAQEWLRRNV